MKTIVKQRGRVTIYSLSDIANALGLPIPTLWWRVYRMSAFERPAVRFGRRTYYSEEQFERLTAEEEVSAS